MSDFKLRPIGTKVIIKPTTKEKITKAGIILPEMKSAGDVNLARVMSVGKGTNEQSMKLSKGDIVAYNLNSGDKLEYEGERYIVAKQTELFAIVKN